jgi:hypothetical protein
MVQRFFVGFFVFAVVCTSYHIHQSGGFSTALQAINAIPSLTSFHGKSTAISFLAESLKRKLSGQTIFHDENTNRLVISSDCNVNISKDIHLNLGDVKQIRIESFLPAHVLQEIRQDKLKSIKRKYGNQGELEFRGFRPGIIPPTVLQVLHKTVIEHGIHLWIDAFTIDTNLEVSKICSLIIYDISVR